LLVGCLLALVLQNEPVRAWVTKYARILFWISLSAFGFTLYLYTVDGGFMSLHESILLALLLASTSLAPQMVPSRMLENQLLKSTGVMSYSIYLWQGLFLRSTWGIFGPLLLAASFLLCWRFVEQPGIQLGRRLSAKKPPSEDPAVILAS
jgi:peptidoglycan/LPS O-acetylase OafA/YrhL